MLKKIAIIIATIAATAYLVLALFYFNAPPASPKCKGLEIEINDNGTRVLSAESIEKQLREKGFRFKDTPMEKISSAEIEKALKNISIIEECECYKTHRDIVSIRIRCKEPILHVFDQSGEYYIDRKGAKIKSIESAIYLPVASGDIKNGECIDGLVKIALFLEDNRFWREQIEQIHVTSRQEIVLVPRIGDHMIELGKAEKLEDKLSKLREFYEKGLNKIGWNKYKRLNIEFDKQVICTKKD